LSGPQSDVEEITWQVRWEEGADRDIGRWKEHTNTPGKKMKRRRKMKLQLVKRTASDHGRCTQHSSLGWMLCCSELREGKVFGEWGLASRSLEAGTQASPRLINIALPRINV
jgi:hypothetical protein